MKKRQELILEMIRKKVMRQVGLHEQDITTNIAPIPNPYNNSLDDLEDIDDSEGSLPSYSPRLRARTLNIQGRSLVEHGNDDVGVWGDQNEVGYYA